MGMFDFLPDASSFNPANMFSQTDWTDPAAQARLNFTASLLQGKQGIFPAIGTALQDAQKGSQFAQESKGRQTEVSKSILALQQWLARANHYRKANGQPPLSIQDIMSGKYSLSQDGQQQPVGKTDSAKMPVASEPVDVTGLPPDQQKPASFFAADPKQTLPALQTVESNNDPNAVSPVGALGPMQTMPTTLTDPGFGVQPAKDQSVGEQKRVGDDYYQALTNKYLKQTNDPSKAQTYAVIAYNWGPGNTDKWLANGADISKLPKETIGEVAKVVIQHAKGQPTLPAQQDVAQNDQPPQRVAQNSQQPDLNSFINDIGASNPDEADQLRIAEMQKTKMHTMTPEQVKAVGLPEGTSAQVDDNGKIDVLNKPDWMSQRAYDQQMGIWGAKTGMDAISPPSSNPNAPSQSKNQPPLTGDAFLKTLNPKLAGVVKGIGDGKEKMTTAISRLPPGMKIAVQGAVYKYNPDFDENLQPMRLAAAKSFASGPDGKVLQSFNAASAHINSARPMLLALNNGNMPLFNKLAQEWAYQTGSPVPTNADMIRSFLGNELTKAIAGYQNAESDRKEMKAPFDKANSPQALLGALDTAEEFISGQFRAEKKKYEFGTKQANFDDMLVPEAKAILEKHPGGSKQSNQSGNTLSVPDKIKKQLKTGIPREVTDPSGKKLKIMLNQSGEVVEVP